MPIYEYECTNKKCQHQFEEIQKMDDPEIETCPTCKKKTAKKKISSGGFILKGQGWYKTDFKHK